MTASEMRERSCSQTLTSSLECAQRLTASKMREPRGKAACAATTRSAQRLTASEMRERPKCAAEVGHHKCSTPDGVGDEGTGAGLFGAVGLVAVLNA